MRLDYLPTATVVKYRTHYAILTANVYDTGVRWGVSSDWDGFPALCNPPACIGKGPRATTP
jgi:hypothetical protein